MDEIHVEKKHPRAESIKIREAITHGVESNVVALAGLIAHGRGEAFDYILGEKTTLPGMKAITASAAYLILAQHPVLSVNGNVAALCSKELVELSKISNSKLEVNLFHRTVERELAIENLLKKAGADTVLGVGEAASSRIQEIYSDRRRVDPEGIYKADVVFVPLEDGDRTQGLVKMGKKVLTVDLNPLSRTAQWANVTIVDNVIRAMPLLISEVKRLKTLKPSELKTIIKDYDNKKILSEAMIIMEQRLHNLAEKGVYLDINN